MGVFNLILLISLSIFFWRVSSHGRYMVQNQCSRALAAGVTIMGNSVIEDSQRSMIISRGENALTSEDSYVPGETLTVSISSFTYDIVFEVRGKEAILQII